MGQHDATHCGQLQHGWFQQHELLEQEQEVEEVVQRVWAQAARELEVRWGSAFPSNGADPRRRTPSCLGSSACHRRSWLKDVVVGLELELEEPT